MKSSPLPSHLIKPALHIHASYPLATSAASHVPQRFVLPSNSARESKKKRVELCTDQKGFFDHLKSRSLILSTFRVLVLQVSQVFTGYLTDQLQHESKLEQELTDGKISPLELEIRNNQWEEAEWEKRLQALPGKIRSALVKYHALMLIMRFYEKAIGLMADEALMEKLTKDAFKAAVRKSRSIEAGERKPDGYAKEMFDTCLYSNMVSFLADYSIQQGFLAYAYYLYIMNARKQKKFKSLKSKDNQLSLNLDYELNDGVEDDLFVDPNSDDIVAGGGDGDGDALANKSTEKDASNINDSSALSTFNLDQSGSGGILFSFVYKSSHLVIARAASLFMAGLGGAFGSTIYPGWGTLFGVQIGDACASALLED